MVKGRTDLLEGINKSEGPYFIFVEGSESDPAFWTDITTDSKINFVLQKAKKGVLDILTAVLERNALYILPLGAVREGLQSLALKLKEKYPNEALVGLSRVYSTINDCMFDINRMVDLRNRGYELAGPRPHTPPIDIQIKAVREETGADSFILVDDVCFDGQTARTLAKSGLPIEDVIGGIVTEEARKKLTSKRIIHERGFHTPKRRIRLHNLIKVGEADDFVDTLPIHDFIPFAPLSGKTVGRSVGYDSDHPEPFVIDGSSFSKPYLLPYVRPDEFESWSSIPAERALEVSVALLKNAVELFQGLEALAGHTITVQTLASRNPRFSFPLPILRGGDISLSQSVVEVLEEDLNFLRGGM